MTDNILSRNAPIITSIYGYDASVQPYVSNETMEKARENIRKSNAFTYSSEFLRDTLHKLESTSVPELILWPEVSLNTFTPTVREKTKTPCRILSVGRLHWAKGYQFALGAMKKLLDAGVSFQYHIVGEGDARSELEYSIRMTNLHEHVRLLGRCTPEEVAQEMKNADILLLPSIKEEFGVVLVEAQASGLPIVASRVGGVSEAISENETALLVEARNPQALGDAVTHLIQDPETFHRFSRNGPEFAKKFEAGIIARKMVDFYRDCIEHYKKR